MDTVEIDDVMIEATTDDAVLCGFEGHAFWVPRSVLSVRSEDKALEAGDVIDIAIPFWLAKREGLA